MKGGLFVCLTLTKQEIDAELMLDMIPATSPMNISICCLFRAALVCTAG